MLPDVDANDGDVRKEWVLVSGGGDLKALGARPITTICLYIHP